jgi:hypothetical protein
MSNQKIILACTITAVVAGTLGYVGGVKMSGMRRTVQFGGGERNVMMTRGGEGNSTAQKPSGNVGRIMGPRSTIGEVIAKDANSMTVKMNDGSSRIIILSDKTTYRISSDANLDKIEVGTKIAAFGETGSDGSITATSIEINPVMMTPVTTQ